MTQIFISYKRQDRDSTDILAKYLIENGFEVWWDVDLLPGDDFFDVIKNVISNADAVIVIWTEQSAHSRFVRSEAQLAFDQDKLISLSLEGTLPPFPFTGNQALDLRPWLNGNNTDAISPLIRALEKKTGGAKHARKSSQEVELEIQHANSTWKKAWALIRDLPNESLEEYELFLESWEVEADPEIVGFIKRRIPILVAKNHEDFWRKSFNLGFAFIFVLVGFAIIWPVVGPNSFIENGNSDGSPIPKSREQTATPEIETVGEIENKESSPIDGVGRYVEADDPSESFSSDVAIENQPDAAPGEITTNAQVGVEQTSQSEENEVQKPQSNRERKLLTVRVYAGKIEGEKVQRVMNDLGVTVEPRNRDVCLRVRTHKRDS